MTNDITFHKVHLNASKKASPLLCPKVEKVTLIKSNTRAVTSLPPISGDCALIGQRPQPITEHTHGKSLKKIQKSVGKLPWTPHQQVRARPANNKRRYQRICSGLFCLCASPVLRTNSWKTCCSIFKAPPLSTLTVYRQKQQNDNTFQERPGLRTVCRGQE